MAKLEYLIDKLGELFFPITHESAVKDSNGVTLTTKLNAKADKSDTYTRSQVNKILANAQSTIIIGPLPASGVTNTIYRVPGSGTYSDYAWNGSQFVKLAEYTGAYDAGFAIQ